MESGLRFGGSWIFPPPSTPPSQGSDVESDLRDVQQIHSNCGAVVAICEDGRVVTWGNAQNGGDSSNLGGLQKLFFVFFCVFCGTFLGL